LSQRSGLGHKNEAQHQIHQRNSLELASTDFRLEDIAFDSERALTTVPTIS
jgi:hypothetical protein